MARLLPMLWSSGLVFWPVCRLIASEPALTIYNQEFAVVRDHVALSLKAGLNEARFADVTAQVEPDSVMLRDAAGKHSLQILEQNYRNDPISQGLLLSMFEGKTIEFEKTTTQGNTQTRELVPGKIVRSGYVSGVGVDQPIIEVKGKLQFSLPGQPLFPSLGDDTILKPTLNWLLHSDGAGKFDAEVSYVTGGLTWEADYNLVGPEQGDTLDLTGWITINNRSGKTFPNAKIKLMAGDVNKIQAAFRRRSGFGGGGTGGGAPRVEEKAFDEYHLYSIARQTTLRDQQMKQLEFVRAADIQEKVIYIYDGASVACRFIGGLNENRNYGMECNKKVSVAREFTNSESNHLGLPLPKGKCRFYRRDADGQLEFIGEDTIDHTPRDEILRVNTGNAFDLVGERKQTDFKMNVVDAAPVINPTTGQLEWAAPPDTNSVSPGPWIDESFQIKLRNHKKSPAQIRVVEHLYRWSNWVIASKSDEFVKADAQTIEFRSTVRPDDEKIVTYTVHYSW